ncbi:hypothetical protein Fot_35384 [Forsythia ovata]|uniref:Uncharacterized protein n=1 Tax=Forsythia ovata TaxID=205694 RepID=A0ABD1SLE5_9LAMI
MAPTEAPSQAHEVNNIGTRSQATVGTRWKQRLGQPLTRVHEKPISNPTPTNPFQEEVEDDEMRDAQEDVPSAKLLQETKSSNVRNKNGFADMIREMDEISSNIGKAAVVTLGKGDGSSSSLLKVSNTSSMVDKSAENIQPLLSPSCYQTLG